MHNLDRTRLEGDFEDGYGGGYDAGFDGEAEFFEMDDGFDLSEQETKGTVQPPDPDCVANPLVFNCFQAYKTGLERWHVDQMDRLELQIVGAITRGRDISAVLVVGHAADWRNSDPKMALGFGRASSVAAELRSRLSQYNKSVSRVPVLPLSVGDSFPIASNDTQSGRRLNRRVSVQVLKNIAPRTITEDCKALTKQEIQALVYTIFGRAPQRPGLMGAVEDALQQIYHATVEADRELCKEFRKGASSVLKRRAYAACLAVSTYIGVVFRKFNEPSKIISYHKGAAYALMDVATGTKRDWPRTDPSSPFVHGYGFILARLAHLRSNATIKRKLDEILARLACEKGRKTRLRWAYLEFLHFWHIEAPGSSPRIKWLVNGDLNLDYPTVRVIGKPAPVKF